MAASSVGSRSHGCRVVHGVVHTGVARLSRCRIARPVAAPEWSDPLRSLLSLAPDLAQIGLEIHLDRVTLRGDVALLHLLFRA